MPRFRPDLGSIDRYRPGKPIEQVERELGLTEIAKLASNESPREPFPEVQRAVAEAVAGVNRYPDDETTSLRAATAEHLGVAPGQLLFGGGSSVLMLTIALAMGGPGTSAVYAWPSFGLYRAATRMAHATGIEVPLDGDQRHDLDRMLAAVRADTTVVYVCNPNNPTGTHVGADALFAFIDALPGDVLVVVDEAYHEYVRAVDYHTAQPLAVARDNVVVARTFSKVYGLAGLRCGYLVGRQATLEALARLQLPFTVGNLAQVAARTALGHQDRVAALVEENAAGVKLFTEELAARGIPHADSQANFVWMQPGADGPAFAGAVLRHGVIVRPLGPDGWVRVTVGTEDENRRFFAALDSDMALRPRAHRSAAQGPTQAAAAPPEAEPLP